MTTSERDIETGAPGGADDASAISEQTQGSTAQQPAGVIPSMGAPGLTLCGSYKEAKQLAATGRRSGNIAAQHVRAVFLVRLDRWCVQ